MSGGSSNTLELQPIAAPLLYYAYKGTMPRNHYTSIQSSTGGTNMYNKMKKLIKTTLLLLLCTAFIMPKANGYALTERQKAINAYSKYLSYSKTYVLKYGTSYVRFVHGFTEYKYNGTKASSTDFAIMYINNDDIPELIVRGDVGGYKSYGVYTYKNGKVQFVYREEAAIFRGCYTKTGYFVSLEDLEACPYVDYMRDYVQMSGTRATKIFTHKVTNGKNVKFWIKGQPVSEAKYTRAIRGAVQNKKMTAVKYYKNTRANRKKVLR